MDMDVQDLPGGVSKVVLRGRFDTTGAVLIELPFNTIATEKRAIIVDLSDVSYIDSAGLAALIQAMQKVEGYGGKFMLAGLQETVRSIFEISRLDQVFQIFPDADSALAG